MITRRDIFKYAAATGAWAMVSRRAAAKTGAVRIGSLTRRDETTIRYPVSGDNWHMSWGADDRQYVSLCDGYGWSDRPSGMLNSRLVSVTGDAEEAKFETVAGYPTLMRGNGITPYYNFGTLALDGRIYQYLSTFNHAWERPDGTAWPDLRFVGAKLIYSPDNGRSWCNQDGSTPVIWQAWDQQSRDSMIFFNEPQEAFSLNSILQMGRNYELNRDGYVYVYAPNGNTEGTMNELVMFRVPKAQVLNRKAYEYFAGLQASGNPKWDRAIGARRAVHTFPRGWVNKAPHPWAWIPSVTYNAPLRLYMMSSWGTSTKPNGEWFANPSYLGFWIAGSPWGPWAQIHEETAWTPDDDSAARAYSPVIAPKWIAPDGRSFWLVWTDYQVKEPEAFKKFVEDEVSDKARHGEMKREDWARVASMMRKHKPYYAFNVQRVDLIP